MATLNPDAPIFVSSAHNPVPYSPLELVSAQNPNLHPVYYLHPIYIPVPTPYGYGVKVTYGYSPVHYIPNQYITFPPRDPTLQLDSPPSAPVPSCVSIKELDENSGSYQKSDTPDEQIKSEPSCNALVLNLHRIQAKKQCRVVIRPPSRQSQIVRPPRCQAPRRKNLVKVPHQNFEIGFDDTEFLRLGKATLMIKNIPSKFRMENMLSILRNHCIHVNEKAMASLGDEAVLSEFDYVYVPIDFERNRAFGYAFVNFTSPIGARRLYHHLHNHSWSVYGSCKVCAVNYAEFQGLAESIAQADLKSFPRCIPDVYLPVHFEPACNGLNFNECVVIRHGRRQ